MSIFLIVVACLIIVLLVMVLDALYCIRREAAGILNLLAEDVYSRKYKRSDVWGNESL